MVFSENNVCPPGKSADPLSLQQAQEERRANAKQVAIVGLQPVSTLFLVGVTRFELATTRPPDAYSKPG